MKRSKNLKTAKLKSSSVKNAATSKNVAIVYRLHTEQAVAMASDLTQWLNEKGHMVFTAPEQKLIPGTKPLRTSAETAKMDLVIVLGGDGTYLRAVRMIENRSLPVLGFNMGSLGFLTAHTADEVFNLVDLALKDQLLLQKRSVIRALVTKKGKTAIEFPALNDVVIERGSHSHLISTTIFMDKQRVSAIKADGLIISTPTGSTAYNLAAGGPILHPQVKAFVVTPVAAHSLTSRPLIFPDDQKISFKLDTPDVKALLIVDGQKVAELSHEDELEIRKCDYEHLMLREPKHNFFNLLREKLKFGGRN